MKTSAVLPVIIALGIVGGVIFFVVRQERTVPSSVIVPEDLLTPTPTYPPMQESVVVSPNGKAVLTMKQQDSSQGKTYSFFATTKEDASPSAIFSKTVDYTNSIQVPFNTWSPDNKYLFLKENIGSASAYYVIQSSGALFDSDKPALDVDSLFLAKFTEYDIEEITGWASETLLIVNTKNKNGNTGPSFWFEIPSRAFIRLSTRFD